MTIHSPKLPSGQNRARYPNRKPAATDSILPIDTGEKSLSNVNLSNSLSLVDEVVSLSGLNDVYLRASLRLLLGAVFSASRRGSMCVEVAPLNAEKRNSTVLEHDKLPKIISALLGDEDDKGAGYWASAIRRSLAAGSFNQVVGRAGDNCPLILDGEKVYSQRMHLLEIAIAETVRKQVTSDVRGPESDSLHSKGNAKMTQEQSLAVQNALNKKLSIISGGPGTGKTSVISVIVQEFIKLGTAPSKIALAAPTGKATRRLQEVWNESLQSTQAHVDEVEPESLAIRTVHRLLRYNMHTRKFRHGVNNPVPYDLVIVDEASMIGAEMMLSILQSTDLHTKLVIIGDRDQLPSVQGGAVFADVTEAKGIAVTKLTRNFRIETGSDEGRRLARIVNDIAIGDHDAFVESAEFFQEPISTVVKRISSAHRHDAKQEVLETISTSNGLGADTDTQLGAAETKRIAAALTNSAKKKFLCATRVHRYGTAEVNALCQEALYGRRDDIFRGGDPVVFLRNDYSRNLFNGDQGIVICSQAKSKNGLQAQTQQWIATESVNGTIRLVNLESVRNNIQLSYALTVHQSQGSEYDEIVFVLPTSDSPILTRELLYTAITRAKHSAKIIGAPALARAAINRPTHRASGLLKRLG